MGVIEESFRRNRSEPTRTRELKKPKRLIFEVNHKRLESGTLVVDSGFFVKYVGDNTLHVEFVINGLPIPFLLVGDEINLPSAPKLQTTPDKKGNFKRLTYRESPQRV